MFQSASLYFSVDGIEYTSTPLSLTPPADRIFEDARRLEMRLYRQVGRFVRLEMTAAASWLLISEINFDSGEFMSIIAVGALDVLAFCSLLVCDVLNCVVCSCNATSDVNFDKCGA